MHPFMWGPFFTFPVLNFWTDWFDLLAVQWALKSLLQYHSSKASILWHSAFFMVQHSHPYMTSGKTIALTVWTFVGKVMSLLFNTLSRFVIAFLPRSKHLHVYLVPVFTFKIVLRWVMLCGQSRAHQPMWKML